MRITNNLPSTYRFGLMRHADTLRMFALNKNDVRANQLAKLINDCEKNRPDNRVVCVEEHYVIYQDGSCSVEGIDSPIVEYYEGVNTLVNTLTDTWIYAATGRGRGSAQKWVKLAVKLNLEVDCEFLERGSSAIMGCMTSDGRYGMLPRGSAKFVPAEPNRWIAPRLDSCRVNFVADLTACTIGDDEVYFLEEMKVMMFPDENKKGTYLAINMLGQPRLVSGVDVTPVTWHNKPAIVDGINNYVLGVTGELYRFAGGKLTRVRGGVYVNPDLDW